VKPRFALLFLGCSASTLACAYLADGLALPGQIVLFLMNFVAIGLSFWWYLRTLPTSEPPAASVWTDGVRLAAARKLAIEQRTGKSFERLRSETEHWLRRGTVPDSLVYGYAVLAPRIRAIVEAEVLAGNTVDHISGGYMEEELTRVVVTLHDGFRRETLTLPRGERWGWEHFYVDPESGHEVKAIFRRSSETNPILCEHLRDVEIAIHHDGQPLLQQFGNARGRWVRFQCDLASVRARFALSEFVMAYEEEHQAGPDWYAERRLYCSLCGCGIEEAGGPKKMSAAIRVSV
jgi:hypothetical protein